MAKCHHLFQHYNNAIKLTDTKRVALLQVRDSLRMRMRNNYYQIPVDDRKLIEIYFQSQGSFVMDTIIKPVKADFDLDDGVYFQGTLNDVERPEPKIFHNWIVRAIDTNSDYEKVEDKPTCVRVKYKHGFHIDIPIYYASNFDSPDLAETNKGWILSNPVEFIAWFEEKAQSGFQKAFLYEALKYAEPYEKWLSDMRKKDCQLRRLVRYMKAWADLKRSEMPCGIIMTILVANNFVVHDADDISMRNTLVNIKNYLLNNGYKCPRPTSPVGEDLFASTSQKDKDYFMNALNGLIQSASKAINAVNEKDACLEWEKHFGSRFPSQLATETPVNVKNGPSLESLRRTASVSTPWSPKS